MFYVVCVCDMCVCVSGRACCNLAFMVHGAVLIAPPPTFMLLYVYCYPAPGICH